MGLIPTRGSYAGRLVPFAPTRANKGGHKVKSALRIRGLFRAVLRSFWLWVSLPLLWLNVEGVLRGETSIEPTVISIVGHVFGAIVLIGLPLAYGTSGWVYVAQGWPLKGIVDFCKESTDPEAMMARMEKIWATGFRTPNGHFRTDGEYLIWTSRLSAGVVPLKDVLWAWTNIIFTLAIPKTFYSFAVYTADGKVKRCVVGKWDALDMEMYLAENFPDIVVGPDKIMWDYLERGRAKKTKIDVEGAKAYIRQRREEDRARYSDKGEQ